MPKDYQKESARQFEEELSKLMDVSDGEELTAVYVGKKKLQPEAS